MSKVRKLGLRKVADRLKEDYMWMLSVYSGARDPVNDMEIWATIKMIKAAHDQLVNEVLNNPLVDQEKL